MSAQEDFNVLSEFAEWLGLEDEDERDKFFETAMTRKGHKKIASWADAEPKDRKSKDGNVLGLKKASGSGWQY